MYMEHVLVGTDVTTSEHDKQSDLHLIVQRCIYIIYLDHPIYIYIYVFIYVQHLYIYIRRVCVCVFACALDFCSVFFKLLYFDIYI